MTRGARISKALEWVIIAHGALALIFAVLTAAWIGIAWLTGPRSDVESQPLATILVLVGFAPLVLVAAQRRGELVGGKATDRLKALYFIASGLALAASLIFFNGLAHDIALWLGHHGRFGCHTLNAAGHDLYVLDEDTLPWLLFLPGPLVTAVLLRLRSSAPS